MRKLFNMSLLFVLCSLLLASCEKPFEPEQKDWENTTAYFNSSDEVSSNGEHPEITLDEIAARVGLSYVFCPDSRIKPFIKGGLNFSWNTNMKEKNVDYKYKMNYDSQVSYGTGDLEYSKGAGAGIYLGAGVDISHIRISAFWKKALGGKDGLNEKNSGILTAAYIF